MTVNIKVGPSKSKSIDINNYGLKLKPEPQIKTRTEEEPQIYRLCVLQSEIHNMSEPIANIMGSKEKDKQMMTKAI